VWPYVFYAVRVSFGVILVASLVVVFTAIIVLLSAGSGSRYALQKWLKLANAYLMCNATLRFSVVLAALLSLLRSEGCGQPILCLYCGVNSPCYTSAITTCDATAATMTMTTTTAAGGAAAVVVSVEVLRLICLAFLEAIHLMSSLTGHFCHCVHTLHYTFTSLR
jgi:hypothetical protein